MRILYATGLNPELQVVHLDLATSTPVLPVPVSTLVSMPQTQKYWFDTFNAPGELGNGKSISLHTYGIFLGRTVGNKELYALSPRTCGDSGVSCGAYAAHGSQLKNEAPQDRETYIANGVDTNVSVRKLQSLHDGGGVFALVNTAHNGFQVFKLTNVGADKYSRKEFTHIAHVDTPDISTDMFCIGHHVFISTQSTITPFIMISAQKDE
jgi:hypothetical protein